MRNGDGPVDLKNALGETGEAKLKTLAEALRDRPALELEIAGYVDREKGRDSRVEFVLK